MKKRNPILSFILSLFVSGLGQVYNGELKKGMVYLIIIFPILLLIALTGVISHLWGFATFMLLIVVYKLLVSIEAFRTSKKLGDYALKSINKTWKYLIFTVFAYTIMWYGSQLNREAAGYEFFNIPTSSMEPSIHLGDRITATRIDPMNIEPGDIITFTRADGQKYLGRVVGLPNQKIQIIDDKVSINSNIEEWTKTNRSKEMALEYQEYQSKLPTGRGYQIKKTIKYRGRDFPSSESSNIEPLIIPDNHFYIMADNRNNSMDSRFYGPIPFENIEKKVNYIWWSFDKKRIGIHFNK